MVARRADVSASESSPVVADDAGVVVEPIDGDVDFAALHAADPTRFPCLLVSAADGTPRGRHDLLLIADGTGLVCDGDGVTTRIEDGRPQGGVVPGGFLDALETAWRSERAAPHVALDVPFRGGWALLLGYELAAGIEPTLRLPRAVDGLPMALALRTPAALVRDRRDGSVCFVAESHATGLRVAVDDVRARTRAVSSPLPGFAIEEEADARFLDGVARIHAHLAAGDVFQVNLSRGWRATPHAPLDPAALFAALLARNPAPFAGSLRWGDVAVVSSSPERLVAVRGRRVETRPIAGTRPRIPGDDDAARIAELAGHPKERAEHVMLIDLERNDLGRVCVPGSVRVEELMAVESYAHVHHIESTVAGTLRTDATPVDVIRAVFPGGTITGCPKVRCMQIVAALEREGRGVYTGAMGWLGRDGDLDLNILIRTLAWDGRTLRFRAGAGIVADSDARAELAETRAKARGLLHALGAA